MKMPYSNFKGRATKFSTGVGKYSCGQTLHFASEREMKMKLRMHLKFWSNFPKGFDRIKVPKKATTMREQQLNKYQRMRKVHNNYLSSWMNITWSRAPRGPAIPEHNQEATLYLQELTSALLIQKLSLVHLIGPGALLRGGNTSHD